LSKVSAALRLILLAVASLAGAVLLLRVMTPPQKPHGSTSVKTVKILSADEIRERLKAEGRSVDHIDREGGLYDVTLGDGTHLYMDAATGKREDTPAKTGPAMQTDEVADKLRAAGYRDIGAITWKKGAYRTEATGPGGTRYHLRMDTYSGNILAKEAE
jgi:hypothetical protein